ncbi:MAG: EF-P lysine aminoacylase GenX [Myxococcaceae bacterium]|nr:EF-P lysine aminoacylase GenX [Myxococcaceae bacterium]
MNRLTRRHQAKKIVRHYFDEQGFLEVDSPVLIRANAVEAFIDPIWVQDEQLRTSPELYLKRLLARGYDKIYELGHVFRDESEGQLHLREFTLLEWYRTHASLMDLVADCEELFRRLAPEKFHRPFEVVSLQELWQKHVGIDLRRSIEEANLPQKVTEKGFALRPEADFSDAFHQVMWAQIEPQIGQETPCVVTRWPRSMAALSAYCADDPCFAERFEIYYQQVELANAFLELTDPQEQRRRFQEEQQIRESLGKRSPELDHEFLEELASMPVTAGIAVGFDRLLMVACDAKSVSDVTELLKTNSRANGCFGMGDCENDGCNLD